MRIDLAGFGRDGTLGNHPELMHLVERADALGFDGIWFNEFHFKRDALPYPSTLLLAAEIFGRTERLRFGTSILVLPLHHPLMVAEQIAQLDFQSGGRIDVGVGRGTDPSTFTALEIERDTARERFAESLDILTRAWTQDNVSGTGPTWTFSDVSVGPPPVQRPHPPLYVAGVSDDTIGLAAERGFPLLLSLEPNEDRQLPVFHRQLAARGRGLAALRLSSLSRYVIVAATQKAARDDLESLTANLNARRARMARARDAVPPPPRSPEEMLQGFAVAGTPEMCVNQLQALSRRTGTESIRCLFDANGLISNAEALAGMELFAREALPALRHSTPTTISTGEN